MMLIGPLFLLLALRINALKTCSNERAVCINIRDCGPLVEIHRSAKPLTEETLNILRNSEQCGNEGPYPMVCCINQSADAPLTVIPLSVPSRTSQPSKSASTDPPDVVNHPNLRLLEHQRCGPITEQKIIGGNKTSVFDYPWMVLIAYDTGRGSSEFRCGGTVINRRYVLTAAHCVTHLSDGIKVIGARLGDHDISKELDCDKSFDKDDIQCSEKYQDFGVESVHSHPHYTKSNLQNDIALIRLNRTVDFTPLNFKPICLPFGSATKPMQKKAIVTGWGATEFGPHSQDLLQARLPLVTSEQCASIYKNTIEIWHKQICAGGLEKGYACMGDSGGPLQAPAMYYGNRVRMVQYGVVSYGQSQCDTVGFPGVYTNVAYYMDWILNTMRD